MRLIRPFVSSQKSREPVKNEYEKKQVRIQVET